MKYSILVQTRPMRDISGDPFGKPVSAKPAPERIHAVDTVDGQVVCSYEPRPDDMPYPDRDWMTVQPGEQPCGDCDQKAGRPGGH